jgi:hypothetical protein
MDLGVSPMKITVKKAAARLAPTAKNLQTISLTLAETDF